MGTPPTFPPQPHGTSDEGDPTPGEDTPRHGADPASPPPGATVAGRGRPPSSTGKGHHGTRAHRLPGRLVAAGIRRPRTVAAVLAVTMASGLLFWTSASSVRDRKVVVDVDLVGLVREQQDAVQALDADVEKLQAQIGGISADAAPTPAASPTTVQELEALPVRGPGVTVTLTDAPAGQVPEGASPDDLVIHQQDIEDVMNALWSGGAEAMTVQGARITSRSVIRCIGNVILIDGSSYSPPYVISAIGDPERLSATVDANPRIVNYKAYVVMYGLGWQMEKSQDLAFEASGADQTLTHARVGDGNG